MRDTPVFYLLMDFEYVTHERGIVKGDVLLCWKC